MLTVRYVGPFTEGVVVDALGAVVLPGETIEVPDDGMALSMIDQVGVWEPVSPSQAARKLNEAAAAEPGESAPVAPEGSD